MHARINKYFMLSKTVPKKYLQLSLLILIIFPNNISPQLYKISPHQDPVHQGTASEHC